MADYTYSDSKNSQINWWEEKTEKICDAVFAHIKYLDNRQGYRRIDNLRNMRLYGNLRVLGISAAQYARTESEDMRKNRVTINIVQSMCDTVTNKIAKNRPKVMFLTEGGDFSLQMKAKKLNKFVAGQFAATDLYQVAPKIFLDSTVFDIGALKIYERDSKICVERVFPDEIRVDDMEAVYGTPRQLHQEKDINREVLCRMFPKHEKKIREAKSAAQGIGTHDTADMVKVIESWHLPSAPEAKDGKHAISIENQTLFTEAYEKEYFPFAFLKWSERLRGFCGQSLAERLTGKQLEINKILRTIQISQHLLSVPKVLIDVSSNIVSAHLNNEIGGIIKYAGMKPEIVTPQAVNLELYNHLKYLIQTAYEEAGVSVLSAQSKKPSGLDSGKALREFNDIESERFMLTGQAYEQFFIDVAKQKIALAREIFKRDGKFQVMVKGKKFLETIDWAEIDLEDDQYVMQPFPTAFLSQTPSGKLQDIQELVQAGFIDKENGMRLLDFPDLESYMSLSTASIEDIDMMIEVMIDKGEYVTPEPFQNLSLGIPRVQSAYLRAKINNVPEERLELLRRWIEQANALLNPPVETPMLPEPVPMAVPETAPVSDLLPVGPVDMPPAPLG